MGKNKKQQPPASQVSAVKPASLFVYDTLNTHHVQRTVWGEVKTGASFVLNDYELKVYANNVFYIEKRLGETVSGKKYQLTEQQLKDTDWFESEAYERELIRQNGVAINIYRKVKGK